MFTVANLKHMDIIKRGVDSWNTWRVNNSHAVPSLSEAGLHMAYLNKANLSRADLSDAGLRLADLIEANLKGADLYWANLSEANLRGANLRGANLQGTNMTGSNLRSTRLNAANLSQANVSRADLNNAELIRAKLNGADLNGADLRDAVLKDAILIGTNLTGANLDGADLSNAIVGATLFGNVDLSRVKGLETLLHLGPSTVGIDTVYKSRGNIPVTFLKSAGVSRHLIDYIELFVDRQEEYYSCFISYAEKNRRFARKLFDDLRFYGIRCWLATERIKKRDRREAITLSAVKLHDKIILIMSEDAMEKEWLENEFNAALEKEMKSAKTVVVPVILDDAVHGSSKPWAIKMRNSRYIYDFSGWEEEEYYEEALENLLAGLSVTEEPYLAEQYPGEEADHPEAFHSAAGGEEREIPEENAMDLTHEFRAERRRFG